MEFQAFENEAKILGIFAPENDDDEVESVLFLNDIHKDFDEQIKKQEKFLKNSKMYWEKIENNFREDSLLTEEKNLKNF